jgi:hypothetical protein
MPIDTPHPSYQAMTERWQRVRDVVAGADAIRAAGTRYLPAPLGMTSADFRAYLMRALFYGATSRTVQALAGAPLHRPPRVTGADAIRPHLADVTLRDEPLELVAGTVLTELLTVGRVGLALDMPASDDPASRPYWLVYRAEAIVNWRTAPVGSDPDQLVLVVVRESVPSVDTTDPYVTSAATQYREMALIDGGYQVRIWRESVSPAIGRRWVPGEWITPLRRGTPLDFIPFTFVNPAGVRPDVASPPLLDLVEVNLSHYRSSADHEHGLHWTALPTPWVAGSKGDGPLRVGPSTAWLLEEHGRAGLLEFTGAGLGAIREAMRAKEALMATLGARLLEQQPDASETATAVRLRHSGEQAALSTIARTTSAALTRLLQWHAWWAAGAGPIPLDARVAVSDEFFVVRAQPAEIQAALLAVQADAMSFESFYHLLEQGGWTRPGVTAAQERHLIATHDVDRSHSTDDVDAA